MKRFINNQLYPQALKASTPLRDPLLTNSIFALLLKSNSQLHPFLSTSLITHFSLSGDLSRAAVLLRQTPNPDTAVYNSLISGFARASRPGPVFELFGELNQLGLKPDVYTLSGLIKACDCIHQNEIAHGFSIKLGFCHNVFVISGLIDNYSRWGFVNGAEKCFEECSDMDSVVFTAMVNGYVCNCEFEKGRSVFMQMRCLGFELNEFSLTSVIGALFDVKEGEMLHGFSLKIGFLSGISTHLNNALMNMYCRLGSRYAAVSLFDEIPNKDVVSWTERIGAASDGIEAFGILKFCRSRGLEMNEFMLCNVLSVIGNLKLLECGKQIHMLSCKAGHMLVVSVCNAMISMYAKCRQTSDAERMFDEMICRDSVSWNSMISGYSENSLYNEAITAFCRMGESLVRPNKYTIASILEVVSNSFSPRQTMQIHSLIIKFGFESDCSMISSLITSYGKCNGISESKILFAEIDESQVSLLNAILSTFIQANCHFDALESFQKSLSLSLEVDSVSFSLVLKVCGALSNLDLGRTIHSLALKSGFDKDVFVQSAIIDSYCKCGSIDEAETFFRYSSKGNIVILNAMLMGYAQRGCYDKVFNLFNKMSEFGMIPDEITYLGVLTSCCHMGLVKEAQSYLSSMFELHSIVPCLEHYACVIDVLGRVGLIEEAKKTIDRMPICPDAYIWQILLSACNIHKNIDLGIVAGKELMRMQPDNDSCYVLLSNLYASAGMWGEMRSIRKEMRDRVINKEAGSSWVQVRGSTKCFLAGEALDLDNEDMLLVLKHLRDEMLQPLDPQ